MEPSSNLLSESSPQDIARYLVHPPTGGPEVCASCRSWNSGNVDRCNNCRDVESILGEVWNVLPISLYVKPSELRDWLKFYKPSGGDGHAPEYGTKLSEILARFFKAQMHEIKSTWGPLDGFCVVPSTKGTIPHPLCQVYDSADIGLPLVDALIRGSGPLQHRHPNRDGFTCTSEGAARRIAVLDDVYTTGARAQSAAYALKSAGFEVPGIVTIARRLNLDYADEVRNLWDQASARPFDFSYSCLRK